MSNSKLSDKQIQDAKEIFNKFDSDKSGKISAQELGRVLSELGMKSDDSTIKNLLDEADVDKNGEIDFDEFLNISQGAFANKMDQTEQARKTFDEFDTNKDGYINKEEFINALKQDPSFNDEEIEDIFNSTDLDKDGKISFEEFNSVLAENM